MLINDRKFDIVDHQRFQELLDGQSFKDDYALLGQEFGVDYILSGEIEGLEMNQPEHEFKSSDLLVKELYGQITVHVRIIQRQNL